MASGTNRGARRQTYVALLRGINLGARNKVAMADLRTLIEDLGGEDVVTYVQSGNVVFKSRVGPAKLADAVEKRIKRDLGLGVTVLLRTKPQLSKVLAGNPFASREGDPLKLHVTFLAEAPDRDRVRKVEANQFEPDEFHVARQEVYLFCPNGYGRSKLSNAYFEKQLDVRATTRNWKTVTKLVELAERA
jgi:uncharacterized protein (DUF1697 family)